MGALSLAVGLVPVVLFLLALMVMDSYKLVTRPAVLTGIGAGVLAASACYAIHVALLQGGRVDPDVVRRWIAPLVEEGAKGIFVVWLIRASRVGFMVDAGILGFAAGTGFALAENLYYAQALQDLGIGLWLVRGLGTAIMHGSTTAAFGIVSKSLSDRRGVSRLDAFLPGYALAAAVHALFNYVVLSPLVATGVLLVSMPLFIVTVFEQSERATADWLGRSFDTGIELLESIESGAITDSPLGRYLSSLHRFPGPVVADMLCLLRVHAELALRAKGVLIARSAGVVVPLDDEVKAKFAELHFLERSIGKTGRMALQPFLSRAGRDVWQLELLRQ